MIMETQDVISAVYKCNSDHGLQINSTKYGGRNNTKMSQKILE